MKKYSKLIIFALSSLIIGLGLISFPFIIDVFQHRNDPEIEAQTKKEVEQVIASNPQLELKKLTLWEGDSIVNLVIKDKGEVGFWYRLGGPPRIEWIKPLIGISYSTNFMCEKKSFDGKRQYAYDTDLVITNDSPLRNKFSFEIKTISDLASHFDELVKTLSEKFPVQKETLTITDKSGTREFVKETDPKYSFKIKSFDSATCYSYIKAI